MADPNPTGRAVIVIHQTETRWRCSTWLPPEGLWQKVSSADFTTHDAAAAYAGGACSHTGAMISIIGRQP